MSFHRIPISTTNLLRAVCCGALLVRLGCIDAAAAPPAPSPSVVFLRSSADSSASLFEIRRIPRSEFLPARASLGPRTERVVVNRETSAEPTDFQRPFLWDNLGVNLSGHHATNSRSSLGSETRSSVHATRLLSVGDFDLDFELARRGNLLYMPRIGLKLDTFRGWRLRIGDVAAMPGGPACRGLTGRGLGAERSVAENGRARDLRFGIIGGWAPVQYANLLSRRFPRRFLGGTVFSRLSASQELTAEAFGISESPQDSDISWQAIRRGGGIGLSTSIHRGPSTFLGEVYHSQVRFADGPLAAGSDVHLRGRSRLSNLGLGVNIERSSGEAYHAGPYGSLQPVPRSVLDIDASYRAKSGWNGGVWGGNWKQIPVPDASGSEFPEGQPDMGNRALQGRQLGARIGWTLPRLETGVTLAQEWRRRTLTDRTQDIRSSKLSFDQRVSRGLRVTLQMNSLRETGTHSRNYITGSAGINLGRGAVLSVQQQTVWQEPIGPQLLSTVELSSLRLRNRQVIVGASATQVHEESGGAFRPSQTQAAIDGRVRISGAADLVVRFQMNASSSQRNETFEIGFTHALSPVRDGQPITISDPASNPRPMLGGIVFEDRNGDGIRQGDEPGIPDVRVIVDNDIHEPVVCDVGGRYRTSVSIGRHQLRLLPESIPVCYSIDGITTIDVDASPERPVASDFPLVRLAGAIEGSVLHGDSGGADLAAGARAIEGVRIVLDGVQFTYTDAHGRFAFRHLAPGDHTVRIDPASLPFGFRTEGEPEHRVVVSRAAEGIATCEFRLFRPVQRKSF